MSMFDKRCDYCGRKGIQGIKVSNAKFSIGRIMIELNWIRKRVCIRCLDETDAPLSSAELARIAERMKRNFDINVEDDE